MFSSAAVLAFAGVVSAQATVTVTVTATSTSADQLFAVTPEVFNGPTASGVAPFLAQTNPAPFEATHTFHPNTPLETDVPIAGNVNNSNIFQLFGQLSHYFPNPSGFGVQEMPLPPGANITWMNMLSRHGSRYPTSNSSQLAFGTRIAAAQKNGTQFSGVLDFLNTWKFQLGYEVMVPVGKQELFDSGVLHYYDYAHLYEPNKTFVARSTTQERMRESGEYFLAGFFGLEWQRYAKLEVVIEQPYYNDTLAGYFQCNNSNLPVSATGNGAVAAWEAVYLKNATANFKALAGNYNWTTADTYAMQGLCAYETVAYGYSAFCGLFTYDEWQGYEYSVDLSFAGNNMFQSPTGRAVGIGFVQEVLARINKHFITDVEGQVNVTLDSSNTTFPLDQKLYFDFSHDTNIAAILTAFNFTQFATVLPATTPDPNRQLIISHMTPFGARLDIEIINAPKPVSASRTCPDTAYDADAPCTPTQYIHFLLNQRTLPLFPGYPECGQRTDGWCELNTFLKRAAGLLEASQYEYSCFGNYSVVPYGNITNGVPIN